MTALGEQPLPGGPPPPPDDATMAPDDAAQAADLPPTKPLPSLSDEP